MRTPALAWFVIALLFFAQVDDFLIPAATGSSAPVVDDDDEYLSPERAQDRDCVPDLQNPVFISLKPETPGSLLRQRARFEAGLAVPFGLPPLYVFMSFQC